MGPGHFGIGFAAKPAAPKAPLWALLLATELLDILSIAFLTLGIEQASVTETTLSQGLVYKSIGYIPWSHGLLMSIVWSLLAAGITCLISKDIKTGGIMGLAVFSHWVLDFIVHGPDLPLLFGGSPMTGLGLWTSGPGLIISAILELVILAGGIAIYIITRKRPTKGYNQATNKAG
ncbi:MAG: hypothetical protein JXJ17_15860 [Anaerolineae bacterium]|nr:hypothetical protein [Anaerolineae bacterium]